MTAHAMRKILQDFFFVAVGFLSRALKMIDRFCFVLLRLP